MTAVRVAVRRSTGQVIEMQQPLPDEFIRANVYASAVGAGLMSAEPDKLSDQDHADLDAAVRATQADIDAAMMANAVAAGVPADDVQITTSTMEDFKASLPVPRRVVRKSTIIVRLNGAGKLAAAISALNSDLYMRERWYAPDHPAVYYDDPDTLALLGDIGADADAIMAPDTPPTEA